MRFGPRYAAALTVDAIGAGLLRPFLVVYGLSVLHLPATATGLALSAGLLAGLVAVPLTGRWIDSGARPFTGRILPVAATLLVRLAGVGVLLAAHDVVAFSVASLLLGIGNQVWPPAHAALVATLAAPEPADAPLAAARSLRNAGLGAGALVAALAVTGGPDALRLLAAGTAAGYAIATVLVLTTPVPTTTAVAPTTTAVAPTTTAVAPTTTAVAPTTTAVPTTAAVPTTTAVPTTIAAAASGTGRSPAARVPHERVPGMAVLVWANLPFALCFAVLEVAIPVVLTDHLGASPAWSAILFAGNTVLVVALQVHLVVRLKDRSRRAVLAASGVVLAASYLGFWACGAMGGGAAGSGVGIGLAAICVVAVGYTLGEILYAGSGTALVTAAAPPHRLGHALAQWQLSTGLANAAAPALLLALLAASPALLWSSLAAATLLSAFAVHRWARARAGRPAGRRAEPLAGRTIDVARRHTGARNRDPPAAQYYLVPGARTSDSAAWDPGMFAIVAVWLGVNLRQPDRLLRAAGVAVLLGAALNATAIMANGSMPYSTWAAGAAGLTPGTTTPKNHAATAATRLAFIGDVLPLPPLRKVVSPGDLLIVLGSATAVAAAMRRATTRDSAARHDAVRLEPSKEVNHDAHLHRAPRPAGGVPDRLDRDAALHDRRPGRDQLTPRS